MTFDDILDQIISLLQRQGRVSYRALKKRFDLDDEYLDILKEELLYAYPVVDDEGRGLVWTGDPGAPEPDAHRVADAESHVHALFPVVEMLLRHEGRVTYRTLTYLFGLDDAVLQHLRHELRFKRLAVDEDAEGLVWTGPGTPPGSAAPVPSTMEPTPRHDVPPTCPAPDHPVPEAERRQLTVMFCDLPDSTQLAQHLDAEDLREVIRAYQATAAAVIHQYEGTIAQYLGDGLLVYFGWPVAHEDDASRAVHAGLGIVEAITATLNPRLQRDKGVQIAVRIGIHTGPVVVGEMGGAGRHEHLATGDTVNIASRLEGLATPNTVVISSVTARLVREVFALEDLGSHVLKGVTEPMRAFRVLCPLERHEDETGAGGVPFLVGRDEEVGLLVRRWEQSKAGLGQVVLLSGEAGIGKSSLVAMLSQHVVQEGYTRITFRCSPYHANSALYPVLAQIQRVLQWQPDDPPATRLAKLEHVLRGYSRPLDEVVPLYAALLEVPVPAGRYAALPLTPQQQRRQTQDALVGWLLEEAERHPTLALWEDLHCADPSTLELLGLVLEQTPTVPMLHVLTFRPEFRTPWPTRSHLTPMLLNRLERPQVEEFISHLAHSKTLPDEVVQHIVTKTDGVPLYVEALTKMLLESLLLRETAEAYVLTGPLSTVAIPDTLQDSLMARLDQLGTAKDLAQLGAVCGREFAYDVLQAIASQDDETLQAGLRTLVQAELLYQRGRPPRATYMFKHALIQDAAYTSLLRRTRQQVHQQIAQHLEAHYPETTQSQSELLAHHYTAAGLTDLAVGYWQQAGQHAIRRFAYAEALAHLSQGLQELAALAQTPEHTQQEIDMQVNLGIALMAVKGPPSQETERAYRHAYKLCQQVGETPQLYPVLIGLWRCVIYRLELPTARDIGTQLLSLAQRAQDPLLLMEAHYTLGFPLFWQGETRTARAHAEQGVALHEAHAHRTRDVRDGLVAPGLSCTTLAAMTRWILGYPEQGLQSIAQGLNVSEASADPYSQAMALAAAAFLYQFCHDAGTTRRHAEAAVAVATEHRFPIWQAWASASLGWALCAQGQAATGMAQIRQSLAFYEDTGAQLLRTYFLALLAEACWRHGQIEEGLTALAEALALADRTGDRWYEAEIYRLKGELLLQAECPINDAASTPQACLQKAVDLACNQEAKSLELRAAMSLARLWQQQGKRQEAYDLLAPVYGWFTEGFDTADLQEARTLLDELA